MENARSKKEGKLIKIMVVAWIIAATLGGCVVSLNIQKNNQNSTQSVSQENEATQKNDSTNFNMNTKNGRNKIIYYI
jgi:flagellar basal body-associated protein FliL